MEVVVWWRCWKAAITSISWGEVLLVIFLRCSSFSFNIEEFDKKTFDSVQPEVFSSGLHLLMSDAIRLCVGE